jgi:DNA-binding beta-propeller fold protein YncE
MLKPVRHPRRSWLPALCAALLVAPAFPAVAAELVGVSFADGLVYDVDAQTGAATDPRALTTADPLNLTSLAGIEIDGDGTVFTVTTQSFAPYPSTLFSVPLEDPFPAVTSLGAVGAQVGEGDLALDPQSGDLFAVGLTDLIAPFTLLRIDRSDPAAAQVVGQIGLNDVSALAFDPSGALYALDTGADALLELDPSNASTLSTTPLSIALGTLAGMDIDPATGTVYVADGGTGGTNTLYTLDPATGVLDAIGPLGIASGLSGLAVPEPDAALLGLAACAALAGVATRRR